MIENPYETRDEDFHTLQNRLEKESQQGLVKDSKVSSRGRCYKQVCMGKPLLGLCLFTR